MNHRVDDDLRYPGLDTNIRFLDQDDWVFVWRDNDKPLRWFHDPIQVTDFCTNGKASTSVLDEDNEGY